MVAKCLSTYRRWLYLPETQEKERFKLDNPMDKQVNLGVPICRSQQKYLSESKISNYCIFNHQNCQIFMGQLITKATDNFPILKHEL
jgi:hypothetical protein